MAWRKWLLIGLVAVVTVCCARLSPLFGRPLTEKDYYTPPKNLRVQIYKSHEQYYYLRRYGVDTVHCKKRGLYVFNCETKEIVAICDEPVAMASANDFGVFYVTQADSGTIIHATLDGQKKTVVYKGNNITHIDAFGGKEEKLGIVEDKTDVYVYDPVLGTKTLVYSHSGIETVSFDMEDQGLWLEVRTSSSGWLYHPETKQTHYLPEYSD